ncbi:COQ9 family protein [Aurantiacibacter spongiae]|uniref:COQ9 family protein n=1 Tax=Aurantiacibacter spongiae TaxID=2488860 RepID=A0A3N5DJU3_9SPHN|nr:COQ9 family protein [Aurantiacibacter spongiae]RPF71005.1 COQ9 family protein [Aurantiacibacter spongiae]
MADATRAASLDDATLAEIRLALAPDIAMSAVFDGWSEAALLAAAEGVGVKPALARLAYKGGAMDMIDGWVDWVDTMMAAEFADGRLDAMPVRERIRELVQFRLDAIAGMEEALQRAMAVQAMPQNVAAAIKQGWSSADRMWRLAGDAATDYNHYTKRAILVSIYGATLAIFAGDESEGKADTRAFLDRRIENVMQFEKAKARLLADRETFDVARFLGRLRYPQR